MGENLILKKVKKLYLLRHGEAGFARTSDFNRELTSNGINQLIELTIAVSKEVQSIDFLLCSTAQRTRQTAQVIEEGISILEKEYRQEIYSGKLKDMVLMIEELPEDCNSCLLVGHNPIISLLLAQLTGADYKNMAPGTMAALQLEVLEWRMIGMDTCSIHWIKN